MNNLKITQKGNRIEVESELYNDNLAYRVSLIEKEYDEYQNEQLKNNYK